MLLILNARFSLGMPVVGLNDLLISPDVLAKAKALLPRSPLSVPGSLLASELTSSVTSISFLLLASLSIDSTSFLV